MKKAIILTIILLATIKNSFAGDMATKPLSALTIDTIAIMQQLKILQPKIDNLIIVLKSDKLLPTEEYKILAKEWNSLINMLPLDENQSRNPLRTLRPTGWDIPPQTFNKSNAETKANVCISRDKTTNQLMIKRKGESDFKPMEDVVDSKLGKGLFPRIKILIDAKNKDVIDKLKSKGINIPIHSKAPGQIEIEITKSQIEQINAEGLQWQIGGERQPQSFISNGDVAVDGDKGTSIASQGFESGIGSFTSYDGWPDSAYCYADYWGSSTKRPYSGSYSAWCAANGDKSASGTYDDYMLAYLISPNYDVSQYSNVQIKHYFWFNTEPTWDSLTYDIYDEFSATWKRVAGGSGSATTWTAYTALIDLYSGVGNTPNNCKFRFVFKSDNSNHNYEGAYIDDIQLSGDLGNLTSYAPTGWSGPIVASSGSGTTTNNTIYAKSTVYFDWAIKNSGVGSARKTTYNKLYIKDAYGSWRYLGCLANSGLSSGGWDYYTDLAYACTYNGYGTYTVKMVADDGNYLQETNESDNEYTKDFYFKPLPDLKPVTISTVPSTPNIGEPCTINWGINNTGDTTAYYASGFKIYLYIGGNLVDSKTLFSLAAGYSQAYATSYSSTIGGNKIIEVRCDPENYIQEYDDTSIDNNKSIAVYWNCPPNQCTVISPSNGSTDISVDPVVQWSCSDPDGDALTKYQLDVDDNADFSSPVYSNSNYNSTTWRPSDHGVNLYRNTIYYWRVKGYDGKMWGPTGLTWNFTTTNNKFWLSGTIQYYNEDDGIIKPIPRAKVELFDYSIDTTVPILTDSSDATGYVNFWEITASSNPRFYVKIELQNSMCKLWDNYTEPIKIFNDTIDLDTNGMGIGRILFTINHTDFSSTVYNNACHIFDAIYQTHKWVGNNSSTNWQRPQIKVFYNRGDNGDTNTYYNPGNVGADYIVICTKRNHIVPPVGNVIADHRRYGPYHEYAHAVRHAAYDYIGIPGSGIIYHYPSLPTNQGHALSEGFAEFLPCAVKGDKDYVIWPYPEVPRKDIEVNNWHGGNDGSIVEGAVASILWDLQDANTDADEDSGGLSNKFSDIFNIMKDNKPRSIGQIYSYYRANTVLTADTNKVKRIYYKHGIDYYKPVLGFEAWQSQPIINPLPTQSGCTNIGSGIVEAENSVYPHNGDFMYCLSGADASSDNSFAYVNLFDVNIPLIPGPNYAAKYLSFWVYIVESPGAGCISLELVTAKKGAIRDYNYKGTYVIDQFGQRLHPAGRNVPKGQWVNYICDLSILNPSIYADDTLRQIQVAYDDGNSSEMGDFSAYIDDIEIGEFSYPTFTWGYVEDPTTVKVCWNDNNIDEDGFNVWWKNQSDSTFINPPLWVDSVSGMGGKGYCTITGLSTGSSYNFMVRSKRGEQVSAYEWRYATSKIAAPETPAPPSAKFHTPSLETYDTIPSINVNNAHYDYSSNIFEWERKIDSTGVWTKIKETPSWYVVGHTDATNIIDSNIIFNHDYYYRLRAYNGCGNSEYSVETKIPVYFKPPTNTDAIAYEAVDPLSGTHTLKIDLSWGDNSTIEAGTLVYIKKAGGDSFVVALGPNITSASISGYWDGQWHSIEPLSTYYIKVAQYWMYYNGYRRTEYSNTVEVFVPKIGYTNNNNARKLFRGGDNKLNATFYDGTQIYWASSINNGLSWSVASPKTGNNSSIAEKTSNNSVYSVRVKNDSLLFDSLGLISGFGKVIQAGGKRKLNPSMVTDSIGIIHCVWAETVLTKETQISGWTMQYRVTDTTKVLYSKKTSSGWTTPIVLQPKTVFSTGWIDYPPSQSKYSVIEIPHPTIIVNKIGTTITPHISWEHQHIKLDGWGIIKDWVTDTLAIYTSSYNSTTGNFNAGIMVSSIDTFATYPCLSVNPSGTLALTYQQTGDIYRITNNGSTWSTPYNVSNNTGNSQMPTVAYDKGGAMHILWYDNSESGFVQKTSTLPVETEAKLAMAKLTELPQGEESIVWEDSGDVATDTTALTIGKVTAAEALTTTVNATQIFYRRYKDNAWSPIYRLTASEDVSVYPALPLTDDPAQMGFLWTEGNCVKYKRLPDLDGPMVTVTFPNGGELLYSGRRYNITWSSADNRGIKSYVLYYTTNYIAQDDPTSTDAVTLWRSVATIVGGLNYYSWRVPYNVTSTNCRFKVVAYDSSGNTATDISDKNFTIKSRDIIVVETDKAIAYNNAGKIARSSDGLLHVCYNSIDSVHYLSSSNDGQTWVTPLNLGKGSLPTIVTDSKNMPAMAWIKQWDNTAGGGVFFSSQTAAGWTAPDTLAYMQGVLWDYIGGYSPPAMTIKNDTISLVFEYSYGGGIPPHIAKGWALHHTRFAINNIAGKKDTIIDSYTETIDPPIWQAPASASIATDYKGYDHISWHRKDKVYYRMRKPDGNYGNIMQLSGSGIAQNPCISISGVASTVWEEGGDIYQRTGFDQKWEAAINVSASGANSMMPYICGSDVLWTEDVLSDYEVYLSSYSTAKMTYDAVENLSCTDYASIFPHETKLQTNEGTKTYRIWAEEIEPEVLWGLTFMADTTELEPTYALDAGQVEPSIFTVQRDGYITYGTSAKAKNTVTEPFKTVDYDTTALIYSFDNFDPDKKYKITLSFYQETGQEIKLKPNVNKLPLGEIKVVSGEEAILDKPLPEASYKDGQITLTIEKTKGPIAVCGKILIYENPTGQGHGGAQSEEITSITPNYINKLYQNCPNPFSHKTSFMYQIKNQGQVTFKVYNALGQLVRTLVNETKPAGTYQVEWDGKDGCGRRVSSGVYLYKINAGSFESTKKLIVLK